MKAWPPKHASAIFLQINPHLPQGRGVWTGLRVLGENEGMRVEVECYSGRKPDERPVRFRLDGHEYMVEEVLDQWYGPEHLFFKVRADDRNVYILRHETPAPDGEWDLISFRGSG